MKKIFVSLTTFVLMLFLSSSVLYAQPVPVPDRVVSRRIEGQRPRNVIFVLSDDHRFDAMSFMAHPLARTPHMDAMARHGVHLKNAFVTSVAVVNI